MYRAFLEMVAPEHQLFLAVSKPKYIGIFQKKAIQFLVQRYDLKLVVVDLEKEEIDTWIS